MAPRLLAAVLLLNSLQIGAEESTCFGTPSNGRLEGGVQITESGPNFTPYSSSGVMLGRTYVHSKVAGAIAAAYKSLEAAAPSKTYVYGESGWRSGGRIKPHRTHQNGLAVDFMVPVVDARGKSVPLPTSMTNKFGYDIEFDAKAKYDGLKIDFEAMAEHLYALDKAAESAKVKISRVIFERSFLPQLYATARGSHIKAHIPFMKGTPWVRHDEHYHVDFSLPCRSNES